VTPTGERPSIGALRDCPVSPGRAHDAWPGPHDLLCLADPACLVPAPCTEPTSPAWVSETLERTPCVVVRRAARTPATAPVGIRGPRREQRWATYVPLDAVRDIIRPEDLLDTQTVPPACVTQLLDALTQLPVRVDVQLQSPYGGFAAAEYSRDTGQVLLRTDTGPYLVADPWRRPDPTQPG
jgi:hypothetical protein